MVLGIDPPKMHQYTKFGVG
nr:hypothetical protein [Brasilonema sennae]